MITTRVLCIIAVLFSLVLLIVLIYCGGCGGRENMSTTTTTIVTTPSPEINLNLTTEIKTAMNTLLPKRRWKISDLFVYNQDVVFLTVDVDSSSSVLYFTMLPVKKTLLLEDYSGDVSSEDLSRWTYARY
jgi:hypothetical protein